MPDKIYSRTVIFDGDCGFCKRQVRLGKKMDWLQKLEWIPRLDASALKRFPQVQASESQNRMLSIRPDGKVYGGFFAVRDVMIHLVPTFLPALLLYIPGMRFLGVPAYTWISKNRHRFGGKKEESCSL